MTDYISNKIYFKKRIACVRESHMRLMPHLHEFTLHWLRVCSDGAICRGCAPSAEGVATGEVD